MFSHRNSNLKLAPDSLLQQSLMALASGLLLVFSFPNFGFSFLAWVALAPLLLVIASGVTIKRALWLGWLTGIVFTFFSENWIANSMVYFGEMLTVVAYAVALLFAAILALFPAIFCGAMSRLVQRFGWWSMALAPIVWVGAEWLRQAVTGVTWNALGVSQALHFPIAKLARFGGVYLISAEILTVSTLIVLMLKIRERKVAKAAALLLTGAALFFALPGTEAENRSSGVTVNVLGIQPNLMPNSSDTTEAFNRNLEASISLTREGIGRTPEKTAGIVVWAESPMALFYENDPGLRSRLEGLAQETGSYLLLNTVARDGETYFNSINIVSPESADQNKTRSEQFTRYDKIVLVPFGEFVPWRSVLGRFVPAIVGDFVHGREAVVNTLKLQTMRRGIIPDSDNGASFQEAIERTTNYVRVGAFICYEAAYPAVIRQFVRNGATLLVNVSNDVWFGNTAGARQHLLHAMMRAIENDRDLVRVTNTGISALLTADGRIIDQMPSFSAGAQMWEARARRGQTFYVRHGDWFAYSCLALSLSALAFTFRRAAR
jgi:apolipoprotein N-acyltransferase